MTAVAPVSAVLITWQRCETLLATLARLVALDPPLAEIIVVDNGSVDGTAAAVRAQFPQVILLRRERNAGIDAYNDGFRRATQAYLLILDDDSYPAPDAVARAAGENLAEIASLRPVVDRYFDKVLVNAPDARVRANRLAFLTQLHAKFSSVADFSEIVTSGLG